MRHRVLSLAVVVVALGWLGASASARTITVPRDYSSIQGAIDAAADGDEIVVLPWTYQENINFSGKNVVLRSTDPTSPSVVAGTIIEGFNYSGAIVTFSGTESSSCILSGFTVTGGTNSGVLGHGTQATIEHNVITGNYTSSYSYGPGGGLDSCNGLIQFNAITNNSAQTGGGLQDCNGTIQFNVITSNSAVGSLSETASGGGLASCNGLIANNVIAFNRAVSRYSAWGGGLYDCNGAIVNNVIYGNRAYAGYFYGSGGGLCGCGGLIANCIVWGNTVWWGVSNQLEGSAPPLYCCVQNWPTTGTSNLATDPQFVDPAHGNFHLQSGSPCIDHGYTYYLPGNYFADLDGNCRLAGSSVDIGCYESNSSKDSDGDLLSDSDEAARGTNPNNADTDGDGLGDGIEVLRGTDPLVPNVWSGICVPCESSVIQKALFVAFSTETITLSPRVYYENLSFLGKSLTLTSTSPSNGPIMDATVIDGRQLGSVVYLAGTGQMGAVRGLTLRNGFGLTGGCVNGGGTLATIENNKILGGQASLGGGISGCDGVVRNNTISGCLATNGGGLFGCNGTIADNTIFSNTASDQGGGLRSCAKTIQRNTISDNRAQSGGGLSVCSGAVLDNAILRNSAALDGGGVYNCNGLVLRNKVSRNSAQISGGGIAFCLGTIEQNEITTNSAQNLGGGVAYCSGSVRRNTISGNTAANGGGLAECNGSIARNVVSSNTAVSFGGGLYNCGDPYSGFTIQNNIVYWNGAGAAGGGLYLCNVAIENCTVYGNQVTSGTGGGIANSSGAIRNCILWNNTAASYSQLRDTPIPFYSCIQDWALGGTGNISLDPVLANPAAGDFHLLANSPCIDAGGAVTGLHEDFEGNHRPNRASSQSRGDASGYDMGADEYLAPNRANIGFYSDDFSPVAPVVIHPGEPLSLNALLENSGGLPTGPFWLEIWGSRNGGLTLDEFLADSARIAIAPQANYPFSLNRALYSIPDGPYTVVFAADRLNEVVESDELDNRAIVHGKKILVLRPPTNVDLVVENFTIDVSQGQFQLRGQVRNIGTQASSPFWIEFWGSDIGKPYPTLGWFLCDSIYVPTLAPGGVIQLSDYPKTRYNFPFPTWAGCFVDRPDYINELDETNNYQFYKWENWPSPPTPDVNGPQDRKVGRKQQGQPDLVITSLDFSPASPTQSKPGDLISVSITIENRGTDAAGGFWLEFWGSNLGGFLDTMLLLDQSERISGLAAGATLSLNLSKPLMGVPDAPWTLVGVVDRLAEVAESNEGNNRYAVPRKRVLVMRPSTGANLVLESLTVEPSVMYVGDDMNVSLGVRNTGTAASGTFWIEFWGSQTQPYPVLEFMLADSIKVENLNPGEMLILSDYPVRLYGGPPPYGSLPTGPLAVGCFVDRIDQVNETDESDNYIFLGDRYLLP